MLKDDLKEGVLVEIRQVEMLEGISFSHQNAIYSSKLLRINDDDTLDLTIPQMEQESFDLFRNTRYSFLFIYDSGVMKSGQGVFLQRIRELNVPMAKIKLVTSLQRIQRRDYYRLGCKIDLLLQTVSMRIEDINKIDFQYCIIESLDFDKWSEGTILDISGGGMRFVSETPLVDLPFIFMNFNLTFPDGPKRIGLTGKVLDRQPVPRSLLCTYRVKFIPEKCKAQDDILAYIYRQQGELAKKGLV